MTQPPDQPIGIPGAPLGQRTPQGPSLTKPSFEVPQPPQPPLGGYGYGHPQPGEGAALVLATWAARWGAIIIDGCARLALALVISVIAFVLLADDPFSTAAYDVDGISNLGGIGLSTFFLYSLLPLIYAPVFMAIWHGQTPGKRAIGIRVVTEAGQAPGFGEAFLREAVFKTVVVSWIGGIFFLPWLLNFLWPLWDDQTRAGHDFMARTRVVKA